MNNQYEIEFEKVDPQDYYVDQSYHNSSGMFSAYKPYGVKCIDSQFCALI